MKKKVSPILVLALTLSLSSCTSASETVKPVLSAEKFSEKMIAKGAIVEDAPRDMTQNILDDGTFGLVNRHYAQSDNQDFLVTYSEFRTSQEAEAYLVMSILFLTNQLETFNKNNPGKCPGCDQENIKDFDVYTHKPTGSEVRYIRHKNILISIVITLAKMDVDDVTSWLGY